MKIERYVKLSVSDNNNEAEYDRKELLTVVRIRVVTRFSQLCGKWNYIRLTDNEV